MLQLQNHMHRNRPAAGWFLGIIAAMLLMGTTLAQNYIIDVPIQQEMEIYREFNLRGDLYLKIRTSNGDGCAHFYWIKYPFWTRENLGERCGIFKIQIPTIFQLAIGSSLRARAGNQPLKIGVAAEESVLGGLSFVF
jgi:hypothetical protein